MNSFGISGMQIYDFDLLEHQIWPANFVTSGTMIGLFSYQHFPQTPFPFFMRVQATGP